MQTWHTQEPKEIFDALHTSDGGLSANEAVRRFKAQGANALPDAKVDSVFVIFLQQFKSPLIYVLFGAGAVLFLLGEAVDALIILFVLVFNAVVGAVQEGRAQNTLRALKKFVATTATVLRDKEEIVIPDKEVVVGDIILLQEGEKVPADARLLAVSGLKIDEASLTGESEPVVKMITPINGDTIPASEQRNMVFKGSHVVSGSGRAVVVATGADTVIGSIAKKISSIDSEIPLKANIRHLSRAIIIVVSVVSVALFLLGLAKGEDLVTIFAAVVSLAVSVIPEGLPIVITLVLATGVWRMSKRNALVKKLQAVEALGQASVIAVDKTGTITKNELVIREVWTEGKTFLVGGVGYEPKGDVQLEGAGVDAANHPELLLAGKMAAFCANARVSFVEKTNNWRVTGDPIEASMRVLGEKVGFIKEELLRESPFISEIPFDYKHKYHATVHKVGGKNFLIVEGAPEVVLALCTHMQRGGKVQPIRAKDKAEIEQVLAHMSHRGLRVIAGAMRKQMPGALSEESLQGLVFVSFFGMQDVLRAEVAESVARATAAGIKVVMITGDHKLTARAIAAEAGIWHEGDVVLSGIDIDALSDAELVERLAGVSVFARVTPEHKLRIILAYKKRGEVVAMTGDGVNDAPPLVAADLGVAMGNIGTEVAKEAADIVLLDDNFESIVAAVEEGRSIYKTIKKVILYLFSTSLGEVLVITAALLLGYPLPLLASQIIWLNFVTDGFLTVALAMEPKEDGLLSGKFQKQKKYLVDRSMLVTMAVMALPMMVGSIVLFHIYFEYDLAKASTIVLTAMAVFQWFNAWNCRSETKSIFKMNFFSNPYLIAATALVICLQILAVYTPFFQHILHTVPLSFTEWLLIVPVAATIVVVEEVRKFLYNHMHTRTAK